MSICLRQSSIRRLFTTPPQIMSIAKKCRVKQLVKSDTHPIFLKSVSLYHQSSADICQFYRLGGGIGGCDWGSQRVKASDALDYVTGYTIFNDLSARDMKPVGRTFNVHWFAQKTSMVLALWGLGSFSWALRIHMMSTLNSG